MPSSSYHAQSFLAVPSVGLLLMCSDSICICSTLSHVCKGLIPYLLVELAKRFCPRTVGNPPPRQP